MGREAAGEVRARPENWAPPRINLVAALPPSQAALFPPPTPFPMEFFWVSRQPRHQTQAFLHS